MSFGEPDDVEELEVEVVTLPERVPGFPEDLEDGSLPNSDESVSEETSGVGGVPGDELGRLSNLMRKYNSNYTALHRLHAPSPFLIAAEKSASLSPTDVPKLLQNVP